MIVTSRKQLQAVNRFGPWRCTVCKQSVEIPCVAILGSRSEEDILAHPDCVPKLGKAMQGHYNAHVKAGGVAG